MQECHPTDNGECDEYMEIIWLKREFDKQLMDCENYIWGLIKKVKRKC